MKKMCSVKTLLISPPWEDHQSPSFQIGLLASYAQKKGFDVKALHLHLETSILLGTDIYNSFINIGSQSSSRASNLQATFGRRALIAALLFPKQKDKILACAKKQMPDAEGLATRLHKVLRKIYGGIDWKEYSLVGFTTNHDQLLASLLIASWLKRDYPKIPTVFGGSSVVNELGLSIMRKFSQVDWCVDGDGELALIKLIEGVGGGKKDFETDVPGLIYRQGSEIKINPRRQLADLKGMPDPDYDHYFQLIDSHLYSQNSELNSFLPIEVSRGCQHHACAFCCIPQHMDGHRIRPPSEIAASIDRMCSRYRTASIKLMANMITPECAKDLFSQIASHNRDYKIYCRVRAEMTKESLVAMKRAGVCELLVGIEALDTKLLEKMNKGRRFIDNLQIMKFCEELGLTVVANLLLDFPTESQEDIDRSTGAIDYASAYRLDFKLRGFELHEGSPIYCEPSKYRIYNIDESINFDHLVPSEIATDLKGMNKEFKSRQKPRNYIRFIRRFEQWQRSCEEARRTNRPPIYYLDCRDFLRIEDHRDGSRSVTLEGYARELYLFCDSIRNWQEIKKRFAKNSIADVKKTLRDLVKLKVMYQEEDDYLSLAIKSSNEFRHNMPFQ